MFGSKAPKPTTPRSDSIVVPSPEYVTVSFASGGETFPVLEFGLRAMRIPNPHENIITSQKFYVTLTFNDGPVRTAFRATCSALAAGPDEILAKFSGLTDDEKRVIAAQLKHLRLGQAA